MRTFRTTSQRSTFRFPILDGDSIGGEIIAVCLGRYRDAKTGEEYALHVLPTDATEDEYLGPVGDQA